MLPGLWPGSSITVNNLPFPRLKTSPSWVLISFSVGTGATVNFWASQSLEGLGRISLGVILAAVAYLHPFLITDSSLAWTKIPLVQAS